MYPQISLFNLHLPTFFLVISLSLTFLVFWLSRRLESDLGQNFNQKIAFNLALLMMITGFLGGRIFHVFYEEWPFYQEYPAQIFKFWNGGFVYFGGFAAALLVSYLYLKYEKQNFIKWADFLTPLLSASYAMGRIGCFFEGCCYGQFCELPWAIAGRHPTQIYMALGEFFILGLLITFEKKKSVFDGSLFFKWVVLHSIFRFVFEYFRDDDRGNMIWGLSVSQIFCVALATTSFLFLAKKYSLLKIK